MIDTFITKLFGIEWKTTENDKKNLYVGKVKSKSQAASGNVKAGSKLLSLNGQMVEDVGAKIIYEALAVSEMPLTITFLKPVKENVNIKIGSFVYEVNGKRVDGIKHKEILRIISSASVPLKIVLKEGIWYFYVEQIMKWWWHQLFKHQNKDLCRIDIKWMISLVQFYLCVMLGLQ